MPCAGLLRIQALISIHATHTGRDKYTPKQLISFIEFQFTRPIRAAIICAGWIYKGVIQFQFTRPIRAAILNPVLRRTDCRISIHATHTGRDCIEVDGKPFIYISIHATHTGRDTVFPCDHTRFRQFQFTRPIRAAIIQALPYKSAKNFNSRDPYGPR